MNTLKLSILIATHNRGQVLLDCLPHILNHGLPASAVEVLIVDNASTDHTPDLLAHHFPSVHVIRSPKNAGPVNKNLAFEKAQGEFLLLLDDDAYPLPGSIPQMLRHFAADPALAAAVFDVTLPDGSKEASAYPDVFIGAGTALRRSALEAIHALPHPLPQHFFMQAEEYDLSFRLLNAGFSIKRFADLPLTHLKTPNARLSTRTTRLDVRNNLYLLAKYLPEPLCHQLAADWLDRYFRMALKRDAAPTPSYNTPAPDPRLRVANPSPSEKPLTHKKAYLAGAAEGLAKWSTLRNQNRHLLSPQTLERLFKFNVIKARLALAAKQHNARRILLADYGKNLFAFHTAAHELHLPLLAIADDHLADPSNHSDNYRGTPLLAWKALHASPLLAKADLIVIANLNPVQAPRRAAELRRTLPHPVVDLFAPSIPPPPRAPHLTQSRTSAPRSQFAS